MRWSPWLDGVSRRDDLCSVRFKHDVGCVLVDLSFSAPRAGIFRAAPCAASQRKGHRQPHIGLVGCWVGVGWCPATHHPPIIHQQHTHPHSPTTEPHTCPTTTHPQPTNPPIHHPSAHPLPPAHHPPPTHPRLVWHALYVRVCSAQRTALALSWRRAFWYVRRSAVRWF